MTDQQNKPTPAEQPADQSEQPWLTDKSLPGAKRTSRKPGETPVLFVSDEELFTPEGEIRRPSRFRPATSTRPLSEPLEPPPPPIFPPSDLPIYQGDHRWPWIRRALLSIIGAVSMGLVLLLGIVIGFS